jgi:anaerobic selenocysteine-containing dehydrogenase
MLAELRAAIGEAPNREDESSYPFLLTSRRMVEYYNSWGQDISAARARHGANPAFVHPSDLAALGLTDGEIATIESQHGAMRAVLRAAPDIAPSTAHRALLGWSGRSGDIRSVGSAVNEPREHEDPVSDEVGMARQSATLSESSPQCAASCPTKSKLTVH